MSCHVSVFCPPKLISDYKDDSLQRLNLTDRPANVNEGVLLSLMHSITYYRHVSNWCTTHFSHVEEGSM